MEEDRGGKACVKWPKSLWASSVVGLDTANRRIVFLWGLPPDADSCRTVRSVRFIRFNGESVLSLSEYEV